MLGPLEDFGSSTLSCKTTTSTKKNGQREVECPLSPRVDDEVDRSIVEGSEDVGVEDEALLSDASTQPAKDENSGGEGPSAAEEAFKEKDENEWETVEEMLVYANCVGAVESELIEPGKQVLFLDMETERPLIQVILNPPL